MNKLMKQVDKSHQSTYKMTSSKDELDEVEVEEMRGDRQIGRDG